MNHSARHCAAAGAHAVASEPADEDIAKAWDDVSGNELNIDKVKMLEKRK